MKIYTKTGDQGETGLLGGPRVSKGCLKIEVLGVVDELNAGIGKLRCLVATTTCLSELDVSLKTVQNVLFQIGAVLADQRSEPIQIDLGPVTGDLENAIDQWESKLPPLTQFILPAGCPAAAECHMVRAIGRRAERRLVELLDSLNADSRLSLDRLSQVLVYLNRLSDYLFVMARYANLLSSQADEVWQGLNA